MPEPSQKLVDLDFIIGRIGMTAAVLAAVMYFFFHEFRDFRQDMEWNMQRSIRNERAIMQKLNIPVTLDNDKK